MKVSHTVNQPLLKSGVLLAQRAHDPLPHCGTREIIGPGSSSTSTRPSSPIGRRRNLEKAFTRHSGRKPALSGRPLQCMIRTKELTSSERGPHQRRCILYIAALFRVLCRSANAILATRLRPLRGMEKQFGTATPCRRTGQVKFPAKSSFATNATMLGTGAGLLPPSPTKKKSREMSELEGMDPVGRHRTS